MPNPMANPVSNAAKPADDSGLIWLLLSLGWFFVGVPRAHHAGETALPAGEQCNPHMVRAPQESFAAVLDVTPSHTVCVSPFEGIPTKLRKLTRLGDAESAEKVSRPKRRFRTLLGHRQEKST